MIRVTQPFKKSSFDQSVASLCRFNHTQFKVDQLKTKINQLNSRNEKLENDIRDKEQKVCLYQNIIIKYESMLREEILLYKLQKIKLETIEDAYHSYEMFIKDIEHQISNLSESIFQKKPQYSDDENFSSDKENLKRILIRLVHQKEFNQADADKKIEQIKRVILQKQKLLDQFRSEIERMLGSTMDSHHESEQIEK